MHKMGLGDSVYAAERIMKKRIRKVSFNYFLRKQTPHVSRDAFGQRIGIDIGFECLLRNERIACFRLRIKTRFDACK